MATSPSLACERKGTSRESRGVLSHWQNQSLHGWKERTEGANTSLGVPKSRGTICLLHDRLQTGALPTGCHTSPCGAGASLALSSILRNSPDSPSSPLVQLKKKQALYCLLLAACISQDGFHTTKCHLFALLDQHKKYCVGAWDADRWPLARQQS